MFETLLGVPVWGWLLAIIALAVLFTAVLLLPSVPNRLWKGSLKPGAAPGALSLYCNVLMSGRRSALITLTYLHRAYPVSAAHGFPHFRVRRGTQMREEREGTFRIRFPRTKGWRQIEIVLDLKGTQGRFRQYYYLRWDGALCMDAAIGICENDAPLIWVPLEHQVAVQDAAPLSGLTIA